MYPFERFTEKAKKVLTLAQDEAEKSHHSYIGTEHLLLGLMREEDGLAARVLASLRVEIDKVRATIASALGSNERTIVQHLIPTSRVQSVQRCVRSDLGTVDGDRAQAGQPRHRAQYQHVHERSRYRLPMIDPEAGHGRLIRPSVGADHPAGDVALAELLELSRPSQPLAIRVDKQGQHHFWILGRPPHFGVGVAGMETSGVHLAHHVDQEPGPVSLRPRSVDSEESWGGARVEEVPL